MGDNTAIVISDDEGSNNHDAEVNEPPVVKEEKKDGDMEADDELPDWLPDGWIMEVFLTEDGTENRYYSSPISDSTFTSRAEVLEFLFSRVDERILRSEKCAEEMTLQRAHQWLPPGWLIEVRAGGKNMDMMYKFYVYPRYRLRLQSKEDVLLYLRESKITEFDTNGQCDTSSVSNILARVDLNPTELPSGWIRELVFRKTKDGSMRRDPYYTDPTRGYAFRTMKSALAYLESGKVPKRAFIQKSSLHDIYSFDKCAELHEYLRSRMIINPRRCRKHTRTLLPRELVQIDCDRDTESSEDGDISFGSNSSSEQEEETCMKGAGEEATSSNTINHSRG